MKTLSWCNILGIAGGMAAILLLGGCATGGLKLTRGEQALLPIAVPADPVPAETTAARELAAYLEKITGAKFRIVREAELAAGAPAIYVGPTAFARSHGIDAATLGEEDSILKIIDGNLVVAGGRPRGTLYAAFRLLEDELGCRWYAPWAERVPRRADCVLPPLDRRFAPAFAMRDTYLHLPGAKWTPQQLEQWKWFIVRNRQNGPSLGVGLWYASGASGFKPEAAEIGYGCMPPQGGPHTFAQYMRETDFQAHPEWFSERQGKRVFSNGSDGNHLCLTNPEMRRAFADRVKENMRKFPDLTVFSVSMNDGGNPTACDCANCTAFAARSSWSDLHFDFVNSVADAVKDEFPRKRILSLAYSYASQPPKQVQARPNVLSYLCLLDTGAVTLPECEGGREFSKEAWAKWVKAIPVMWGWDYTQWGPPYPFIVPLYFRMAEEYRYGRKLGLQGLFAENELFAQQHFPPEFYEMRLWIMMKLMEDPDRDAMALVQDFMNGYYGPAGAFLAEYVRMQRERLSGWPFGMVDYPFIQKMHQLFDQAEAIVKDDPELLARVREARICPDITTIFFKSKLTDEFIRKGNPLEAYPYRVASLKERILSRLKSTANPLWVGAEYPDPYPSGPRINAVKFAERYVNQISLGNEHAPLPKEFQEVPAERLRDIPGYQLAYCQEAQLVDDPDSVFGVAAARLTPEEMPVGMGVYDYTQGPRGKDVVGRAIAANEISGPGYHVYKLGRTALSINCRFYFTKSWQIGQDLGMFHDPMNMGQEWDVYVSVKVDGPAYPHGNPGAKNGVYIDRLILVRTAK